MFLLKFAAPIGVLSGVLLTRHNAQCNNTSSIPIPSNQNTTDVYDVCVVGGGIVGLATAREILQRFPKFRVAVVEKESEVAHHQTGVFNLFVAFNAIDLTAE